MARKSISWILKFTARLPNDEEKVKCLKANDTSAIRTILRLAFDPNIKWQLPEGEAPYTPCEFPHQETMLYQEAKRLYLFIEGGNPNLNQLKREAMFVELLDALDPQDAKLLVNIKDKKLSDEYKGLESKHVLEAFPGLY